MMNEELRNMLMLAAKAAGHEYRFNNSTHTGPHFIRCETGYQEWNPRDDDGDSATLEAELLLDVRWFKNSVKINAMPSWMKWGISINEEFPVFSSTEEKKKAKRRAILRAAAAIGKAMP